MECPLLSGRSQVWVEIEMDRYQAEINVLKIMEFATKFVLLSTQRIPVMILLIVTILILIVILLMIHLIFIAILLMTLLILIVILLMILLPLLWIAMTILLILIVMSYPIHCHCTRLWIQLCPNGLLPLGFCPPWQRTWIGILLEFFSPGSIVGSRVDSNYVASLTDLSSIVPKLWKSWSPY